MRKRRTRKFYLSLARASAGSILFTLPMLMTMEMWWLGFHMEPLRLATMLLVSIPLLAGLAYYSGFEKRLTLRGVVVDALVAIAVGVVTSGIMLALFAIIRGDMSMLEVVGKISIQAIPASMGAVLASSELGGDREERAIEGESRSYIGELFLMVSGALYFSFNMAPTEEMVVIAREMTAWHGILLVFVSMGMMHAFVYNVEFHGQKERPEQHSWWAVFSRFTIVGYALALGVSAYCLWSFGRMDGDGIHMVASQIVVLGFPSALGAAAARLIL